MTSFFSSFIGRITGSNVTLAPSENVEVPFLSNIDNKPKFTKGIAILDDHGTKAAKHYGWLLSLDTFYQHYDIKYHSFRIGNTNNDNELVEKLSEGILHANFKRTGQAPREYYKVTENDKLETGRDIIRHCLQEYGDEKVKQIKEILGNRFVLCEIKKSERLYKNKIKEDQEAKELLTKIATETGIVIPIVLTGPFMMYIYDNKRKINDNNSVSFQNPQESTKISSDSMDTKLEKMELDFSAIKLNQSNLRNHIDSYNNYASEFGKTKDELGELTAELNSTIQDFDTTIGSNLHLKGEFISELNNSVRQLNDQKNQVSQLELNNQKLERRLREKTEASEAAEKTTARCKQEMEDLTGKITDLEDKNKQMEKRVQREVDVKEHTEKLYEEMDIDLTASESKVKQLKQELSTTRMRYTTLQNNQIQTSEEYNKANVENQKKTNELRKLKGDLKRSEELAKERKDKYDLLEKEQVAASKQNRQLDKSLNESENMDSPRKKSEFKRMRNLMRIMTNDDSDSDEDKKYCSIATIMTSKDANQLLRTHKLDKYEQSEIIDYLERAEEAKTYAVKTAENKLTEEMFMQYLKMILPANLRRILNNMKADKKTEFKNFKEEVLFAYDLDTSEYLIEFQNAKIRAGEHYAPFAMRLTNLYRRSRKLDASAEIDKEGQKLVTFQFLQGIDLASANSIRLVAQEGEYEEIDKIVKHAKKLVNVKSRAEPPETNIQQLETEDLTDLSEQFSDLSLHHQEPITETANIVSRNNNDFQAKNRTNLNQLSKDNNNNKGPINQNNNNNTNNYRPNNGFNNYNNRARPRFDDTRQNAGWKNNQNYRNQNTNNNYNNRTNTNNDNNDRTKANNNYTDRTNTNNNYTDRTNVNSDNQNTPNNYNYRRNNYENYGNSNRNNESGIGFKRPYPPAGNNGYPWNNNKYQRNEQFSGQNYGTNMPIRNPYNAQGTYQQYNTTPRYTQGTNQQYNTTRKPGNCRYCGISGHWKAECRKRLRRESNAKEIANVFRMQLQKQQQSKNLQPCLSVTLVNPKTGFKNNCQALIDSGSALTCVNSNLPITTNLERISATTKPTALDGRSLNSDGEVYIDIQIGNTLLTKIRAIILRDMRHSAIIGNNILMQCGFSFKDNGKLLDIGT